MRYPCPCCGYLIFDRPLGSNSICTICFWEDDWYQLEYPYEHGGPNHLSLADSQKNFAIFGACEVRLLHFVRHPYAHEAREVGWRKLAQVVDVVPADDPHLEWQQRPNADNYYWRWNHLDQDPDLPTIPVQQLLNQGQAAIAEYAAHAHATKRLGPLGLSCMQLGRICAERATDAGDLTWAATALAVYDLISACASDPAPCWKGEYDAMMLRRDLINMIGPRTAHPILDLRTMVEWFCSTFPLAEMQQLSENHLRLTFDKLIELSHFQNALALFDVSPEVLPALLVVFPNVHDWQRLRDIR